MKKKIVYWLKYSPWIFYIYHHVMSGLIRFLGLFIKIDNKLILFNCFGGRKYDDSPKAVYEKMMLDSRFSEYRLVWALQEPDKANYSGEVVKSDSFQFFKTALAARIWITNSSMERGLRFKKKGTFYLNTWHGSAIKRMGSDIVSGNTAFSAKLSSADIMLAQSQYDVDIFSYAFAIPPEKFRMVGLPRNDELLHYTQERVHAVRRQLGIPSEKKVLLYAPTYREYTKGEGKEVILRIPMDMEKWQNLLGEKYIVLFRAHYEVAQYMNTDGFDVFIDVSSYPNLADLMVVSDALISDYSSISIDYSVMHKPIYCFAYDYDEYISKRGMYMDLSKELPCKIHRNEDSLLDDILNGSTNKYQKELIDFQKKYATYCGNASKCVCDIILEEMEDSK